MTNTEITAALLSTIPASIAYAVETAGILFAPRAGDYDTLIHAARERGHSFSISTVYTDGYIQTADF